MDVNTKFGKQSEEWRLFQEFWQLSKEIWNPVILKKDKSNLVEVEKHEEQIYLKARQFYLSFKTDFSKQLTYILLEDIRNRKRDLEALSADSPAPVETFANGSEIKELYSEYWRICKAYWDPVILNENKDNQKEVDEYWASIMETAKRFEIRFQSNFAKQIIFALLKDIEARGHALELELEEQSKPRLSAGFPLTEERLKRNQLLLENMKLGYDVHHQWTDEDYKAMEYHFAIDHFTSENNFWKMRAQLSAMPYSMQADIYHKWFAKKEYDAVLFTDCQQEILSLSDDDREY